jgi:hypothetical protein
MADYEEQIAKAEQRLRSVQDELDEIEVMKAKEPKLRRDEASLIAKIADLKEALEAENSEQQFFQREKESVPDAKAKPKEEEEPARGPTAPVQRNPEEERKAKMKALNKKLQQIDKLKQKDASDLDEDARKKLSSEPKLRKKLDALARGEEYEDSEAEQEPTKEVQEVVAPTPVSAPAAVKEKEEPVEASDDGDDEASSMQLPTDPAEVEKRTRTLKKKLQQIAKLKEKGQLDAEAVKKVAGEYRLVQELQALEEGRDEVTFEVPPEPTDADIKFDLEKKLKTLRKKLDQIKSLKEKGGDLDADARAKVESEAALVREANALAAKIAVFEKEERQRLAERMGWEAEAKENEEERKRAKKSKAKAASASKS